MKIGLVYLIIIYRFKMGAILKWYTITLIKYASRDQIVYTVIIKFIFIISQVFKNINMNNHSLFLFFTERQFQRPLVIIVCLISIQQLSGHFLLTYKLQCLYGKLYISEIISTVTAILLLQVFPYFYRVYLLGMFK